MLQGEYFRVTPENISGLYLVLPCSSNLDFRRIGVCKQGQISQRSADRVFARCHFFRPSSVFAHQTIPLPRYCRRLLFIPYLNRGRLSSLVPFHPAYQAPHSGTSKTNCRGSFPRLLLKMEESLATIFGTLLQELSVQPPSCCGVSPMSSISQQNATATPHPSPAIGPYNSAQSIKSFALRIPQLGPAKVPLRSGLVMRVQVLKVRCSFGTPFACYPSTTLLAFLFSFHYIIVLITALHVRSQFKGFIKRYQPVFIEC